MTEHHQRPLPKAARRLNAAARAYGDAKVALDRYEGPNHGAEFTKLLLKVRATTVELSAAARAFAADERSKERAHAA